MEWCLTNYGSKLRHHQHVIHVRHILCTIFIRKTVGQKYFFQILSPKNVQTVNLKNRDLYLIRGIHPKRGLSGFMIRAWFPAPPPPPPNQKKQNEKSGFGQGNPDKDFPTKTNPWFFPLPAGTEHKWINLLKREAWLRLYTFSMCFKNIKHENC